MNNRFLLPVIAAVLLAAIPLSGQSSKAYTQRHTPDGQPDLQGVWTNPTITPFERPVELADKQFLTEKEVAELESRAADNRLDRPPRAGDVGNYNQFCIASVTTVVS